MSDRCQAAKRGEKPVNGYYNSNCKYKEGAGMKKDLHSLKSPFHTLLILIMIFGLFSLLLPSAKAAEEVKTGTANRPYEAVWANRTVDDFPPIVDFESASAWTIETTDSEASFVRSREQVLWNDYSFRLAYRGVPKDGKKIVPLVRLKPPKPVPVPKEFDAMYGWFFGNHWGAGANSDHSTPAPFIDAVFIAENGKEVVIPIVCVNWRDWYLAHHRFTAVERTRLGTKNILFNGFQLRNGTQPDDRIIFFDNFTVYKEVFKPLTFTPRAKRGIDMFPGQSCGVNTGEGRLPFPVREETILPDSFTKGAKNSVISLSSSQYEFRYEGPDGTLVYTYSPESGTWSDLTAKWNGGKPFYPADKGGVQKLAVSGTVFETVGKYEVKSHQLKDGIVSVRVSLVSKNVSAEVEYRLSMNGKSLIIDTFAQGGKVHDVLFGTTKDLDNIRTVTVPFMNGGKGYAGSRPAVLVFDNVGKQRSDSKAKENVLCLYGDIDWYRSNASVMADRLGSDAVHPGFQGGVRYLPKTDGTFNDVFERFVITVSPVFAEVLPTIANPPSPYKHVAGKNLWRVHASNKREEDKAFWKEVWRHGIRNVVINDHETLWRDAGESFTFRTKTAPGKGGDKAALEYSRFLREELGYIYGPYNNFTDYAPINEYWSFDRVARTVENRLQPAWMRCYGPKPVRGVEFCEKLTPIIAEKFGYNTAYCDVHTSVTPWSRTDYDSRVPGAGTFAATFYAYGEIMLLQKKGWKGPVYSEGPNHYFYSGLTDGNYAQDSGYKPVDNPWLVDFDLLKMHPLECNFGMGNLSMFSPAVDPKDRAFYIPNLDERSPAGRDRLIDRFLAATMAFGHTGFLVLDYCFDPPKAFGLAYGPPGVMKTEAGMPVAMRSYFMIQQIASRYTQADVSAISYLDAAGKEYSTTAAIATGVLKENRPMIRYQDGTVVVVNGNKVDKLCTKVDGRTVELPPNGYTAWTKSGDVFVESKEANGSRYDYCISPEYIYLDTQGSQQKVPGAMGTGVGVCRKLEKGCCEIILLDKSVMGFAIDGKYAVALDKTGKELGPAKTVKKEGYLFIEPVAKAFSYRVDP